MAVPQTKDELLDAIETSFGRLMADLEQVPIDRVEERSMEGQVKGRPMSVRDLVCYLLGWNELVLKWMERDAGQPIDYPDRGYKGNELGRLALKFYGDYESVTYPDLLDRLRLAKGRIVDFITARDNAELYGRPWYEKWTMGRMIQFNTSSPYANARGRLRRWRKQNAV